MSKDLINSIEIQNFLEDFEKNSRTELLEEGSKEQDEIIEIANAKGINLKDSKDLAGIKLIYTFTDIPNKNKAILPTKELLKALPSIVGKPVDIDHIRSSVVGFFIDYRWIVKEKKVIAYAIIFKNNFAEPWNEMQKLFNEGKLTTSYEIWAPADKRKQL
jgi:hypothetical protein